MLSIPLGSTKTGWVSEHQFPHHGEQGKCNSLLKHSGHWIEPLELGHEGATPDFGKPQSFIKPSPLFSA